MQQIKRVSVILFVLLALIACGANQGIVVDKTGMTPEEAAAVVWKERYGTALDWYEWELNSLKANLALLPLEEASGVYKTLQPLLKTVSASITALGAFVHGSAVGDPQDAYDEYFKAKQALLAVLMQAFVDEEDSK